MKAITIPILLAVASLAGCGFGSGASRAESTVRDAFGKSSALGTLEAVSCQESRTSAPEAQVKMALYDCQVTTSEYGAVSWCLVDGPVGMGPFPLSCASALSRRY